VGSSSVLSAPLPLAFDYTRSTGPTVGAFLTGLASGRILGSCDSTGRVSVPPQEFDPATGAALTELVEVADEGEVVSWTWVGRPVDGQPFDRPFAFALIRLDGADTTLLHAVDVAGPGALATGMRVRARWAAEPLGRITDIEAFVPAGDAPDRPAPREAEPVEIVTTPIAMSIEHSASPQETAYLLALQEGRVIGQRCPVCRKVYVPPRGACPTDGVPTEEEVTLPDTGTVTTFCIVNVPFLGQSITPPYVAAYVLLDGADIAFLHLVLGCDASEVRMGMRVRAKWRPREEWQPTLRNIEYFEPSGEPDAPYDSFKEHL
jgi:uncharacterized OB-fold protein